MNSESPMIELRGSVRDELPTDMPERLQRDLGYVFNELSPGRTLKSIAVPRLFSGYNPDYDVKIVLAVEVTYADGYERHIVKVGQNAKVESDYSGWRDCTRDRMVASRIFAAVRKVELGNDRVAVVYHDAFSLFGPDEGHAVESAPKSLEQAIEWAVQDNEPDPLSAEKAISHVFTDLGLWFYRGAAPTPKLAWQFYARHLRIAPDNLSNPMLNHSPQVSLNAAILSSWHLDMARGEMRRHAVWVLCGRDLPDANPESKPARYLDPVDFIHWTMHDQSGARLPNTLIGRSHGDLHARNVLVGVRRGEVQYPAVFDYGDMGLHNVLAWDFAKLETELKVRLLPGIIRDQDVFRWLVKRSNLRSSSADVPAVGLSDDNARRADRLAAFLAFEELIDELTKSILDIRDVERILPLAQKPTGYDKLDRLAGIVLRIRQEAAYWLGYKPARRQKLWKDELYFALGVYGLLNVRWDYSGPEQEAAIVSSGAALARMPSTPGCLKQAIAAGPLCPPDYPSYRVPLAICYDDWKQKKHGAGCKFIEELVLNLAPNKKSGQLEIQIQPQFQHAIPLVGQALLFELEMGHLHLVEPVLENMRKEAATFHDHETLGRIGRHYKDAGDRKAEAEGLTAFEADQKGATRLPSLQMYDRSFEVYAEAYQLTKDWYVGINAATLALLTGRTELARQYARNVAEACAAKLDEQQKDRYWLHATEGEAALILGEPADVFYHSALSELTPGQWGMADSSYRQACRLWRFFGADGERRVGPVLRVFENSDAREYLTKGFLGRITQPT